MSLLGDATVSKMWGKWQQNLPDIAGISVPN